MPKEKRVYSIREQIADQLRNEILSEQLSPNEPLREEALAERFGTSRGPIRDVLLQLTQEGALVYKPNSGVRVSQPLQDSERTLLMTLRQTIENHALTSFIKTFNAEDNENLEDILETMKRACRKKDMASIVGSDIALHRYIVRRGCSTEVESVWTSITVRIRMAYSRFEKHREIHQEHVRILAAIATDNASEAHHALQANLQ